MRISVSICTPMIWPMPDMKYWAAPSMMRRTKYTAASLSTISAVRVMPTPMAELVMVLMILGRMISHMVVRAAQNRSMNSTFLYLAR